MPVILQYWDYPKGSGVPYLYDSVYSNSKGEFQFNRRKKLGWAYRLWVYNPAYSGYCEDVTKTRPPFKIVLNPTAYLKLTISKTATAPASIDITGPLYYSTVYYPNLWSQQKDSGVTSPKLIVGTSCLLHWTVTTYSNGITQPATNTYSGQYSFVAGTGAQTYTITY